MKNQPSKANHQELTITQEELQELVELQEIKIKAERLRSSIRRRVLKGAKVEPGRHKVHVRYEERIHLTQQRIEEFLGALGSEVLAALPKRKIFKMFVKSSYSLDKHSEPNPVIDPSVVDDTFVPGDESELVSLVLNALPAIEAFKSDMKKEEDSFTTLVKLKIAIKEHFKDSESEDAEETFIFEDASNFGELQQC